MADPHETTASKLAWLQELRDEALAGNQRARARQRERGKLLARELFASEFRRKRLVQVDQCHSQSGASQDKRSERAADSTSDDGDIDLTYGVGSALCGGLGKPGN